MNREEPHCEAALLFVFFMSDCTSDNSDLGGCPPPERPIANSYWIVPGRFAAGEYPGSLKHSEAVEKVQALLDSGIDRFIDLTAPGELKPYADILEEEARSRGKTVRRDRHPIRDVSVPTEQHMARILDAVDAALDAGENVYVHCWGGIGRAGTVTGCWLARRGHSGEKALRQVADWQRGTGKPCRRSPETYEQAEFVRKWQEPPRA